jgi:hypothetical protein
MHRSMNAMDSVASFVRAVSYKCKLFMNLTTGVNVSKKNFFITASRAPYGDPLHGYDLLTTNFKLILKELSR